MKQSSIIDIYRQCHANIENNYQVTKQTVRHTDPSTDTLVDDICREMDKQKVHSIKKGRSSQEAVKDSLLEGLNLLMSQAGSTGDESKGDDIMESVDNINAEGIENSGDVDGEGEGDNRDQERVIERDDLMI